MSAYVEGFVIPLPKKNIDLYRSFATEAGQIWREYGAIHYNECIADDVPHGMLTSFPQSVKLEADEVVVFAWIEFESRAHRDFVNERVMKDPRILRMQNGPTPFDEKRMLYGGFEKLVSI